MNLLSELKALFEDETDMIANAANTSAFLYKNISELNWVGFYFFKGSSFL